MASHHPVRWPAPPAHARRTRRLEEAWQGGRVATERYRSLVRERAASGTRVLHAGCGRDKNDVTAPLRDRCEIVGVDLDSRLVGRFPLPFVLGSLSRLPFAGDSFDLVVCEYVLEHVSEPERAMGEVARVLRPGGRFVALTPNLYSYKAFAARFTPHSFHEWMGRIRYGEGCEADMYRTFYRCNTASRIRRLASRAGLSDLRVELVTNGPTWFARLPVLFAAGHLIHLALRRWDALRQLRCALVLEAVKPGRPPEG